MESDKRRHINNFTKSLIIGINTTCNDLIHYRKQFKETVMKKYGSLKGFGGHSEEAFLLQWFRDYYKDDSNIQVLNETMYPAVIKNQKLDIPILKEGAIRIGVSVKASRNTSGTLDGADFTNPLIQEFKHNLRARKDGKIGINTLLQDIARIENLQLFQTKRFNSITVIFDKSTKKSREWTDIFQERFNHSYIFLMDQGDRKFVVVYKETIKGSSIRMNLLDK